MLNFSDIFILNNAPNGLGEREYIFFNPEDKTQTAKSYKVEQAEKIVKDFKFTPISPIEAYRKGYLEFKSVGSIAEFLPLPF